MYPDAWHIPGGGVDEAEELRDAARREGLEETGIDLSEAELSPLPFVGHGGSVKTVKDTGERVWANMTFNRFEARLPQLAADVELHPTDDLVELRWFGEDELPGIAHIPGGKVFFQQAGYIKHGVV